MVLLELLGAGTRIPILRSSSWLWRLYETQYRLVCERRNKGNKAIEREVISSFQVAQSLGFRADFRAWEHLLRIHE
jgi:hypothetical protein